MNSLLGYFEYKDNQYQIFSNKDNKVSIKVLGKKVNPKESKLVIDGVINEINKRMKTMIGKFKYDNEELTLYKDTINNFYYLYNKDGLINVNNPKYYPIIHAYNFSVESYYNNGFNSFDQYDTFGYDEAAYLRRQQEARKKRKQKKIKMIIAGSLVTITLLVGSFALHSHFNKDEKIDVKPEVKVSDVTINNPTEDEIKDDIEESSFVFNYTEKSVEEQIREALSGEEDWVIEAALKEHENFMNLFQFDVVEEPIQNIDYSNYSEKTVRLLNIIKNNPNINDDLKQIIINNYADFLEHDIKYFADKSYNDLCETLEGLVIEETYTSSGNGTYDGDVVNGYYVGGENKIVLFSKSDDVLTHEFNHVLGHNHFSYVASDKLNEGMTEQTNPLGALTYSYKPEQAFYLILEQIYGRDFMKNARYNVGFLFELYNANGEIPDDEKMLVEDIDHFLIDYASIKEDTDEVVKRRYELIERLKELYERKTGREFGKNQIIQVCCDVITKDNTLGLGDGLEVFNIRVDNENVCTYTISKRVDVSYQDGNTSSSEYYNVTKDIVINGGEESENNWYSSKSL